MIEAVLPAGVSFSDTCGDDLPGPVYAEELAVVAGAVRERRSEFLTVRTCARRALAGLGVPPQPILPDRAGAPGWPPGVVGSMTHCAGYRAAAVAPAPAVAALGIDAEPHERLPPEVLDLVAGPDERAGLAAPAGTGAVLHTDRILFSAKESALKAWYPLTGTVLDLRDVHVTLHPGDAADPRHGTFTARLPVDAARPDGRPTRELHGRWAVGAGLVVTAVVLPAGHG